MVQVYDEWSMRGNREAAARESEKAAAVASALAVAASRVAAAEQSQLSLLHLEVASLKDTVTVLTAEKEAANKQVRALTAKVAEQDEREKATIMVNSQNFDVAKMLFGLETRLSKRITSLQSPEEEDYHSRLLKLDEVCKAYDTEMATAKQQYESEISVLKGQIESFRTMCRSLL